MTNKKGANSSLSHNAKLGRAAAVAAALTIMFAVAACDSSLPVVPAAQSGAMLQLRACSPEQVAAGTRAQCGELVVAENPEAAEGRRIKLNVVRLPAIASSPRLDPLFVFAGGPGEAATEMVDRMPRLFREINRERDLVFVDQRGTGESNPLDCKPRGPTDFSLSARESFALQESRLRDCLDSYEADPRYYTTPFAMDDIDRVRQALDYPRINLWGGSYGTRAALVYMRRHPGRVRSAVLDSVAPFAIQLPHHTLADADNALRRLFDLCEQQSACRQRFGDLEGKTRRLIGELDRKPRNIEVEHPLTQDRVPVKVNGQLVAALIRMGLYQRNLGPILPLAIESAINEDFRPLMLLLTLTEEVGDSISLGMQHTVLCAEDIMRPAPAAIAENSILQLDLLSQMQQSCEFWPQGILPENYFEPVSSAIPTLLVSGELDPVTPPRWAELAAETLSNSLHLRVPGAHHIASHVGCVDELILDFLNAGGSDNLDTACISAIEALSPFVSSAGPAMTYDKKTGDDEAADD